MEKTTPFITKAFSPVQVRHKILKICFKESNYETDNLYFGNHIPVNNS